MKKFSKLLFFLLILPVSFTLSACKNKNSEDGSNNGNGGVDSIYYTISYDYNLPDEYDFLLKDYEVDVVADGQEKTLDKLPNNDKLAEYFLYWTVDGIETNTVKSSTSKKINVVGKWDEEALRNYYFSDGLSFNIDNGKAYISSYSASNLAKNNNIILPKYYKFNGVDYSVNKIGDAVFKNKTVDNFVINAENLVIGESAFENSKIQSFDFSNVIEIKDRAFAQSNIKFVKFSSSLDTIILGTSIFENCSNLTSVDFGGYNGIVASKMFYGCNNLISITGTDNLIKISSYAFYGCKSLNDIGFLGNKLTEIKEKAFAECSGITNLTLPANVEFLGENAFENCNKITKLSIGYLYQKSTGGNRNLLYHLGNNFANSVTEIELIGNKITCLQANYFSGFTSLEKFVMSNSVTEVEDYAFNGCFNLNNIIISSAVTEQNISYLAFYSTKYLNERTTPILIQNNTVILYIPKTIEGENGVYEIPYGVKKINRLSFSCCNKLKKIIIPSTVELIDEGAFLECEELVEVDFVKNDNISTIKKDTFNSCAKLGKINLTNLTNLKTISELSFTRTAIDEFKIPSTVTSIDDSAFLSCNCSNFIVEEGNAKYKTIGGVLYALNANNQEEKLIAYPRKKTDAFFQCPSTVTTIAKNAFASCKNLYIYFPQENLVWEGTEIYDSAFFESQNINVYTESNKFEIKNNSCAVIYRKCGISVIESYDLTNKTIILKNDLDDENELQENVFFKATKDDKIYIMAFKVTYTLGENNKKIYSVINNSIISFETTLTK